MTAPAPSVVDRDDLRLPPPDGSFGATVRFYRERRRLSAGELARRCGFDHSYISRLEKGERDPTLRVAIRVAAVLGLNPYERIDLIEAAGYEIGEDT